MFEFVVFQVDFFRFNVLKMLEFWFSRSEIWFKVKMFEFMVFQVKNLVLRSIFLNLLFFWSIFLVLMFKNVRILVFRGQTFGSKFKMDIFVFRSNYTV